MAQATKPKQRVRLHTGVGTLSGLVISSILSELGPKCCPFLYVAHGFCCFAHDAGERKEDYVANDATVGGVGWGMGACIYDVRIEGRGGVKKPHICGKTVHHFCGIRSEVIKNKKILWTSSEEYP